MITRSEAIVQVWRFAGLPKFSELHENGMRELENAVMRCRDPKHASETVTKWLQNSQWMPTPHDLIELEELIQPVSYGGSRNCERCSGTGFRVVYELHTYTGRMLIKSGLPEKTVEEITFDVFVELRTKIDDPWKQRVLESAGHCDCEYGRHLYRAVMARKAQEDADLVEKRHKRDRAA